MEANVEENPKKRRIYDEESLTKKLQKAVRENNIKMVEQLVDNAYPKTFIDAKLNGKSSIDLASDKDVQLDIWELLLKHTDEKTLAGENSVLESFEQLLQAPCFLHSHAHVPTSETHVCQIKKVRHWLLLTKERTEKSVINLRLHFLCELCRIIPSSSTVNASADDVEDLAVELIKDYKVNLNSNATIYCPLHWAVTTSNVPLLNLFLEHGANIDCLDRFFNGSPLHLICDIKGQPRILEIVEILVDGGASLTIERNQRGYTALHSIIINLNPVELDIFLKKYSEKIKSSSQSMPFPFIHGLIVHPVASIKQNSMLEKDALKIRRDAQNDIIQKLIVVEKHKIDINTKDINGMTILHFSCWLRYTDVVKHILAKSKLPLLQKDKFGRGCLYYAMTQPARNIWPETENLSTLRYILDPSIFILNGREIPKKDKLKLELLFKICTAYLKSKKKSKQFGEPVNTQNKFVKEIIQKVQQFVERLKNQLEQHNSLLTSTIELAGSTGEGTKINPQDEFDYLFKLTTISQCIRAEYFTVQDEVQLCLQTQDIEFGKEVKELQEHDQTLNEALMNSFNTTVYNIFQHSLFWEDLPFYWRTCYYKGASPPKTLVAPLHLAYIGTPIDPDLDISIDLVPEVVLDDLPNRMKDLIPPKVVHFVQNSEDLTWEIIVRQTNARLSFSCIEKLILRNIFPVLKDAYTLAKSLLSCVPETDGIEPELITSYMLKNALFHELDPILSYSLIDYRICKFSSQKGMQMPQHDTDKRVWASRILRRAIKIFGQSNGVNVYCFPAIIVPLYPVTEDEFGGNPYVRVLNQCLMLLEET